MWSDTSSTRRGFMRHTRFHPIKLAWITAVVAGLMVGVATPADAEPGQWDPTLPALVSAGAPGDPLAVANASLQATAQATQTTLDLGRQFLGGLGINLGGPAASAPSAATTGASRIPRANARQAVEYVIRRAGSQMGGALFVGWWLASGPQQGRGLGGQHCRLRLLRSGAVCLRRGRRGDPAVLR
ncbi:invasion-associated protein [Mycobacterium tuberculosis T92]|nr:invasion-associated protein [Mycobacterium tuberculosis T92]